MLGCHPGRPACVLCNRENTQSSKHARAIRYGEAEKLYKTYIKLAKKRKKSGIPAKFWLDRNFENKVVPCEGLEPRECDCWVGKYIREHKAQCAPVYYSCYKVKNEI